LLIAIDWIGSGRWSLRARQNRAADARSRGSRKLLSTYSLAPRR